MTESAEDAVRNQMGFFSRLLHIAWDNKAALSFLGLAVGWLVFSMLMGGCNISDYIKVNVPREVQQALRVPAQVSLTKAEPLFDEWSARTQRISRVFATNIDNAQGLRDFIGSMINMGIELGTASSAALPGGAFIAMALSGVGGLMLRRPGDAKREQQEKIASFNAGQKKMAMMIREVNGAGVKIPEVAG